MDIDGSLGREVDQLGANLLAKGDDHDKVWLIGLDGRDRLLRVGIIRLSGGNTLITGPSGHGRRQRLAAPSPGTRGLRDDQGQMMGRLAQGIQTGNSEGTAAQKNDRHGTDLPLHTATIGIGKK